jgi:hypothetical protein
MLHSLAANLWGLERPLKAPGLRIGHRMTVARLANDRLWAHSPVAFDDAIFRTMADLGPAVYFIAPSRFHDLHWPEWFAHYPDATFCGDKGMEKDHPKLPFHKVLRAEIQEPWESELPKLLIAGMPKLNEFVFLHAPSRTLIVADLVFNIDARQQNLLGKLFLKLNGICGRVGCSWIFRRFILDPQAFRASVEQLLRWDFDRVVPGHGAVVKDSGKRVFQDAFGWLSA